MTTNNPENEKIFDKVTRYLKHLQIKSGIQKKRLLFAFLVSFTFIFFNIFAKYFSYILTTFLPIVWTLKAIEYKESEEDKQWITFWILYSAFMLVDMLSGFITIYLPFYFFIRTLVVLWLYLPNFKGALYVYKTFIIKIPNLIPRNENDTLKKEIDDIIRERMNTESTVDNEYYTKDTNVMTSPSRISSDKKKE